MRAKHKAYNLVQEILEWSRKYIYLVLPALSILMFILFKDIILSNAHKNINDYTNNIINLSGILAGFLFTTFGTFMSLPDNKFLDALGESGYFESIYRVQLLGILFLIIAMLIGLFDISIKYATIFFLVGISESIGSLYYFYKILTLSRKSTTKY